MPLAETIAPGDAEDTARALATASRERRRVRVRGGGTKDHVGTLGETDLVLSTSGLRGIVDHVPADLTVTLRGGTPLAELQAALAAHGQFFPLDAPHAAAGATIGGTIAANANGFARPRYGGVRDLLIGSTIALADGSVARSGGRVVKNVAGYDLNKLFAGSLGTLGVIVEATLKILPLPAARGAALVSCAATDEAFARADRIVRTSLRPTGLVVSIDGSAASLVVAMEGSAAEVARTLRESGGEPHDDPEQLLSPLRELPRDIGDGALLRAALPIGRQAAFVTAARAERAFARCVADAAMGIVRVHLRGDDGALAAAARMLSALARELGGSARVERRPGTMGAWDEHEPEGAFLMKRLKAALDPSGILEPGRSAIG